MRTKAYIIALLLGLLSAANANNIQITRQPSLEDMDVANETAMITFGVSWQNAWKFKLSGKWAMTNWDAAWVFAKYSIGSANVWRHAYIDTAASAHSLNGCNLNARLQVGITKIGGVIPRGIGAFISLDTFTRGFFVVDEVKLKWNYGAQGVTSQDTVKLRVFAIEMVYIPEGAFSIGDGTSASTFYKTGNMLKVGTGKQSINEQITSEEAIYYDVNTLSTNLIPNAFPKGYQAFYIMKHEITQRAYVDFLNTLTYVQQKTRTATLPESAVGTYALFATANTYRNYVRIRTKANNTVQIPAVYGNSVNGTIWKSDSAAGNVACNFLMWTDGTAYTDWCGLRPMTEMEFEKACRGPVGGVSGEFAWGNSFKIATTALLNTNLGTEKPVSGNYFPMGTASIYVVRVGMFAQDSTDRTESGAGFYGALNMSDNVWERCITVANIQGRAFTGDHGDGELDAAGNSNVTNWPNTTNVGAGFRGNAVSDRTNATYTESLSRGTNLIAYGFRAVRTAP